MKSLLSKNIAFLILAICTVGFTSTTLPALAHDPSGEYGAGYERGYQHGYHDAASGLDYENIAESHGAEVYGPHGAGMHEGEHVGYEDGFRAGSGEHRHHHHGFRIILGG